MSIPIRAAVDVTNGDATISNVSTAKTVAHFASTADKWDVLLILGTVMLLAGVWIEFGLAIALIVGGLLFMAAAILGANNSPGQNEPV